MSRINTQFFALGFLVLLVASIAAPTQAAVWSVSHILSDADIEDSTRMSKNDIQIFLQMHGTLGTYVAPDIDGLVKPTADIVARVAKTYRLNPQFLLALMQREQGVVEDTAPTEAKLAWTTGYAVCDRCSKDHPDVQEYRGLAPQLEQTAKRFRENFLSDLYRVGKTVTGWGPGISKRADGLRITPQNRATAALYTYTPHVAGNYLLWRIWAKWFSAEYPDGTLLRSDDRSDPTVWFITSGTRRPITSRAVLVSRFDPARVITVPKEELANYTIGAPLAFPDFSILRSPHGALYLTRGDERLGFPSLEVFRALGFQEDEITDVTTDEIDAYREGPLLGVTSVSPRGSLLRDESNGDVSYLEDGIRHLIVAPEILNTRFRNRPIISSNPLALKQYPTGEPARFRDGELIGIRDHTDIFITSHDALRPIPSPEVFEGMGWKWNQVVWTSKKILSVYHLGEPITLDALSGAALTAATNL